MFCDRIFSPCGNVESTARFQIMGDVQARVNFYSPEDAIHAYCLLQGCQIYEGRCELDLYFASESICDCKLYIPWYTLDYKPSRTPSIPWQLSNGDYNNSPRRSSRKKPPSYLKADLSCYERNRRFIIEDKIEETLKDHNMEANVQVIEYRQLPDT